MNMKQSCKALISAIEGELDGRHCTEEQAAAILDHALPSLTEALARVQSELAEAEGLLKKARRYVEQEYPDGIHSYRPNSISGYLLGDVDAFLARHAQAEQQEAQGAPAGEFKREDRYIVIKRKDLEKVTTPMAHSLGELLKHLPKRQYLVIESDWPEYEPTWVAIQARVEARAALATQPAVPASVEAMSFEYAHLSGERRTVSITREDVIQGMEDALYEKLSDQICRCEPIGETNVVECNCQDYVEEFALVAAPPAAAHGDEAVRWVPCSERLPEVAEFDQQEFIVSVQRKDKVITMSALYLNAYPLYCEDHDDADDEGYVPHTGWYDAKSNGDDANCYTLINDSWYGSAVTHWMPMPKPAAAMRAQGDGEVQ